MAVFRLDPCGIFCMLLTYAAIIYSDYVVIVQLVIPTMSDSLLGAFNAVLFNILLALLIASHLRAMLSDPGIVPLPQANLDFSDLHSGVRKPLNQSENGWTVCGKCETYRPPRAHHCRICRRCIRRMDHHCPWINNCVGENNQKYFLQFLFYVGIAAIHAILIVLLSALKKCTTCQTNETDEHTKLVLQVILVIMCLLFGIFVIAVFVDQVSAIFADETAIEHLQRKEPYRPLKSRTALMQEVCGRGPIFLWLCPCHSAPKSSYEDSGV